MQPGPLISPKFNTRFGIKQCEPGVWIDGVEKLDRTRDLDAYFDVDDVRAVEVYSSPAEVPAGFAGDLLCGAVLIWTRGQEG